MAKRTQKNGGTATAKRAASPHNRAKTGGTPPEASRFKPGQSGNPGGRPKRKHITEMYERILSNPKIMAELEVTVMKALRKGNMAMVLLLKEMAERVEGKVTQSVEVEGSLALVTLSERMAKARSRAEAKG